MQSREIKEQELREKGYSFEWLDADEIKRLGLPKYKKYPFTQTVLFYEYAREYFRILSTLSIEQLSNLPEGCPGAENLAREMAAEIFPVKWVTSDPPPTALPSEEGIVIAPELDSWISSRQVEPSSEEQMANTLFFKLPENNRKKLFKNYSERISQHLSKAYADETYTIKNEAPFLKRITPWTRKQISENPLSKKRTISQIITSIRVNQKSNHITVVRLT